MNMTRQIHRYFRKIERSLPCPADQARKLIGPLRDSVMLYLAEHPDTDMGEIYRKFGTPRELYESYLNSLQQSESRQTYVTAHRRKKILTTVIVVAVCATIGFLIVSYIDYRYNTGTNYTEYLIEGDGEIIEEEDGLVE